MNYQQGNRAKLPLDALVHMVAARYGQHPDDVAQWPADTFMAAVNYLPLTGGPRGRQ